MATDPKNAPLQLAQPQKEPVNQRAHEVALRQWDHWKQYALELQEKLVKYEGGAPMVLNTSPQPAPEQQEPVAEIVSDVNGCLSTQWNDEWTPNEGDKLYTSPPARKPLTTVTIADAPSCLNTNDKAMWVLGWNECVETHNIKEKNT